MTGRWQPGEIVVRRERLGLVPPGLLHPQPAGGVWLEVPVVVVEDTDEWLITYIPPGAPFRFPPGDWPTDDGRHPWAGRQTWTGHGCLMLQRPGEHHAIWHFWHGPERTFGSWYLNLQTAFVRTDDGYDTQDLELDLIFSIDREIVVKDAEVLDQRVTDGRYTDELVTWIRRYGDDLIGRLEDDGPWWDTAWSTWTPPADVERTFDGGAHRE